MGSTIGGNKVSQPPSVKSEMTSATSNTSTAQTSTNSTQSNATMKYCPYTIGGGETKKKCCSRKEGSFTMDRAVECGVRASVVSGAAVFSGVLVNQMLEKCDMSHGSNGALGAIAIVGIGHLVHSLFKKRRV